MNSKFRNKDGSEAAVRLRKVPLKRLGDLLGEISEEAAACLFIAPENRTPEEVKAVFEALDEESQFAVWDRGMDLNESNLEKFAARRKKQVEVKAKAGGLDLDQMMAKYMEENLDKLMASQLGETASPGSPPTDTDGETSKTSTPETSSSS